MTSAETAFLAWVHDARPGSHYVYHIGMLLHEREENPELDALATTVMDAVVADFVMPTQLRTRFGHDLVKGYTRNDDPQYIYIATRTRTKIDEASSIKARS